MQDRNCGVLLAQIANDILQELTQPGKIGMHMDDLWLLGFRCKGIYLKTTAPLRAAVVFWLSLFIGCFSPKGILWL